jgi:hypothetical protein
MTKTLRVIQVLSCLIGLLGSVALAQEGPQVPCADCDSRINSPFPASGPWVNSERTGSGFLFEIQNGVLAGFHFGYDSEGNPQWLLFSGDLEPGGDAGTMWQLETHVSLFTGGSCISCPYEAPESPTSVGTIKLEFLQKNHGRFQLNDAEPEYMVPLLFGSGGHLFFPEHAEYLLPELAEGGDKPAPWVIVMTEYPNEDPPVFRSKVVHLKPADDNEIGVKFSYESVEESILAFTDSFVPDVTINCSFYNSGQDLLCEAAFLRAHLEGNEYFRVRLPIANIGANRFFGEASWGDTLEGFRINYD